MTASVLDIPFANESFDVVIDIGLAQHLLQQDFATYAQEVSRIETWWIYPLYSICKRNTKVSDMVSKIF